LCPPAGVEFAGELTDFIQQDLKRLYPERARAMRWAGDRATGVGASSSVESMRWAGACLSKTLFPACVFTRDALLLGTLGSGHECPQQVEMASCVPGSPPCRITLVEAREVLGSFDPTLREYAARCVTGP
jgi:hypothetical protein